MTPNERRWLHQRYPGYNFNDPHDMAEVAHFERERVMERALAPYGGKLPYRCADCGTMIPESDFAGRPCTCGSTDVVRLDEESFAEYAGLNEVPPDPSGD